MRHWLTGIVALAAIICYSSAVQAAPPGHYGYRGNPYHADLHDELDHREFHRELTHRNAHRYPMSWRQHDRLHGALEHDAFHDHLEHRAYHRYVRPGRAPVGYGVPYYGGGSGYSVGYSSPGLSFWFGR